MKFFVNNKQKAANVYESLWRASCQCERVSPVLLARTCAHAHMILTALSKRDAISWGVMFLLTKVVYSIAGAPYGPVKIGIARPVTDDNSQMMINQLRGRLAAAASEAAANTVSQPPSTASTASAAIAEPTSHNNEEVNRYTVDKM